MSLQAQFILVLSFIIVEMVGIAVYAVLSSDWFAKKFADKIENATVHVWNGKGYDPVKGQLIDTTLYETYRYKIHGHYHEVDLQPDYPVEYEKRRRIIYARIGKTFADSLPGHNPVKYSESSNAAYMSKEAVKAAFTAIKKNGLQLSATMLIIIALVVAALGIGAWYYTSHNKKAATTTTKPNVVTTQVR